MEDYQYQTTIDAMLTEERRAREYDAWAQEDLDNYNTTGSETSHNSGVDNNAAAAEHICKAAAYALAVAEALRLRHNLTIPA